MSRLQLAMQNVVRAESELLLLVSVSVPLVPLVSIPLVLFVSARCWCRV
jgi:hypothetical protein